MLLRLPKVKFDPVMFPPCKGFVVPKLDPKPDEAFWGLEDPNKPPCGFALI